MKIAISGASGFVGQNFISSIEDMGYQIEKIGKDDFSSKEALSAKLQNSDIVINFAGAPIIAKWTESYKKVLRSSRIDTTRAIVELIKSFEKKPELFISTSAVGRYDNRARYSEDDSSYATDLLGEITKEWEEEALRATEADIRTAIFRFGVVIGKNGGMMQKVLPPFKLGVGGVLGDGKQAMSWVHIQDLTSALKFAIDNKNISGIYNLVAPCPTTNMEFTKALGKALHRPTIFPVPAFVLKIIFGEGSKVLLDGQEVVPKRLLESGFSFKYKTVDEALEDVVK